MKDFKNWLETKDYNPYPPDNTEKQTKDGPHYPKNKNLIQHTEKTQLQVKEAEMGINPRDPYNDPRTQQLYQRAMDGWNEVRNLMEKLGKQDVWLQADRLIEQNGIRLRGQVAQAPR